MAKQKEEFVTHIASRTEDFPQWYTDIILKSDMVDYSEVKGCMVIKPYGYAVWELMQHELDTRFKATGHKNAYFPLFIPEHLLQKEKDHVEGFAPEVAWVTQGGEEKLAERLCVRPTSETIICSMYSKWIQSYRDLPLLYNQWANVVRWEKNTRPFLRTSEFLWQEGHTAHATSQEAQEEAKRMVGVYARFARDFMALPVIVGHKSPNERFAGALDTLTIEAMMQDGKALQAGTSHFLGQNFAKSFDVKYTDKEGLQQYVWATSWGVSTRLMGALVMAHGDDNGLVLPPALAPIQVVMVPIYKTEEEHTRILDKMNQLKKALEAEGHTVKIDDRDTLRPGFKFAEWELKGVPVRLAMGPRDLENGTVEVHRRDTLEKQTVALEGLDKSIAALLDDIQKTIYRKAFDFRASHVEKCDDWEEFKAKISTGKFLLCHWDGTAETEQKIKDETKATIRCIPVDSFVCEEEGRDIYSGKPSKQRVVFAISY